MTKAISLVGQRYDSPSATTGGTSVWFRNWQVRGGAVVARGRHSSRELVLAPRTALTFFIQPFVYLLREQARRAFGGNFLFLASTWGGSTHGAVAFYAYFLFSNGVWLRCDFGVISSALSHAERTAVGITMDQGKRLHVTGAVATEAAACSHFSSCDATRAFLAARESRSFVTSIKWQGKRARKSRPRNGGRACSRGGRCSRGSVSRRCLFVNTAHSLMRAPQITFRFISWVRNTFSADKFAKRQLSRRSGRNLYNNLYKCVLAYVSNVVWSRC